MNVVLHATTEHLVFALLNPAPLPQLITNTLQAMSRLASVSLMPGAPRSNARRYHRRLCLLGLGVSPKNHGRDARATFAAHP